MNPTPLHENQDLNDLPISPSTARPSAETKADAPRAQPHASTEKLVDTNANPTTRPPGASDQDEDATDAKRHIDQEPGGPAPTIGN